MYLNSIKTLGTWPRVPGRLLVFMKGILFQDSAPRISCNLMQWKLRKKMFNKPPVQIHKWATATKPWPIGSMCKLIPYHVGVVSVHLGACVLCALIVLTVMGALFFSGKASAAECCRLIHHLASVAFNVKLLIFECQCGISWSRISIFSCKALLFSIFFDLTLFSWRSRERHLCSSDSAPPQRFDPILQSSLLLARAKKLHWPAGYTWVVQCPKLDLLLLASSHLPRYSAVQLEWLGNAFPATCATNRTARGSPPCFPPKALSRSLEWGGWLPHCPFFRAARSRQLVLYVGFWMFLVEPIFFGFGRNLFGFLKSPGTSIFLPTKQVQQAVQDRYKAVQCMPLLGIQVFLGLPNAQNNCFFLGKKEEKQYIPKTSGQKRKNSEKSKLVEKRGLASMISLKKGGAWRSANAMDAGKTI